MPSVSAPHITRQAIDWASTDLLDLSVIIVNYNVRPFLEQALSSVRRACDGVAAEVFVVDNNSVDGSVEMVRSQFPEVHLIANEENVGFGRANNQAIRRARGRCLLILNPDTIVQEDSVKTLLAFMETHPEAGAAGCQILNPDGTFAPESRRTFPTPSVAFYRITGLSRLFPKSRTFGRYNLTYLPRDEVVEVDALSGSCMMVRRAALFFSAEQARALRDQGLDPDRQAPIVGDGLPAEADGAGLFDEAFFMYGEDLDWCYRIQQAGWRIFYTPETQIIHYKGESTKQGEMRYVRMFYGAMLQFTNKHFHGRYSWIFATMLRFGILLRAGMSVVANTVRNLKRPLMEFGLVLGAMEAAGWLTAWQAGRSFSPFFYGVVAPGYALFTVLCIAMVGGYGYARHLLRTVFSGVGLAFVSVSVISFFVRSIAYSRAVVLLGFAWALVLLVAARLMRRRRPDRKRALLVGHAGGARQLQRVLAGRLEPPFDLVGYVPPDKPVDGSVASPRGLRRLGSLHQLRDLVRLRRIDEVVFAASDLSNQMMFHLIRQMRDLPVQFKVLAPGCNHLIGKASIEDLSTPMLVEAEAAVHELRSPLARRLFEIPMALVGLSVYPFVALLRRMPGAQPSRALRRLRVALAQLPGVLRGHRALVGYDPAAHTLPPSEWGLKPGVFSIVGAAAARTLTPEELNHAYWTYAQNQSATLDLSIALRYLQMPG